MKLKNKVPPPPPTVVYVSDVYDLEDRLGDLLAEEDISAGWVDNGIGAYEYWGFRGVHSDWCVEADAVDVDVRILEAPTDAELPETVHVRYSGGGCDGEHRGRCKRCCAEWEVEIEWHLGKREVRDGVLWATYEPEQV